jgi:PBSX family phage terminase large subunit
MQQVAQATKGDNQSFRNVNEIYQEIEAKQDRQEIENDEFSEAIDAFSISHKQLDILQFQNDREHDSLICDGAIRSGKTSFMMLAFVDWAMRNFKSKSFIILGKTVGSAVRNVVEPYMALTYAQRRYKLTWAASKSRLTVERGGVTNYFDVFGGADASSYQLIQGFTAAGCLIDEVALCHQSAVNQALARCSVAGSKYWFNCNPDSPHHWFYQEWILRAEEQKALHLHFKLADNPGLTRQVIERYERQYHGVFKQRYIDGEWVVAEGLVYQYEDREYTIEPEDVPAGGMYYLGCDYGITNPFACLLIKVAAGKVYVIDEYVFDSRAEGRRLTDEEHYVNVEKLAEGHNIQELVIDPSATSMKETIYRHGKFDVVDADNDVIAGIRSVDQALAKGDIKVSTKCQGLIREMGLYRWDDSKAKDTVIKEFDHCADALRYCWYTSLRDLIPGYLD